MAKSTDDQDQVGHPKEKNHDLSKNARVRQSFIVLLTSFEPITEQQKFQAHPEV